MWFGFRRLSLGEKIRMEFDYRVLQKVKRGMQKRKELCQKDNLKELEQAIRDEEYLLSVIDMLRFRDQQLGIYNLTYWMTRVSDAVAKGKIGQYHAVYFNLKHFSMINDTYGRDVGTEIMKRFVVQLDEYLGDDEYLCRIGGDNFALFFQKRHLSFVMDYLQGAAVSVDGTEDNLVHVEACAGYYMIPEMEPISDPNVVMDRISEAYHTAKTVKHKPYIFWNKEMTLQHASKKSIESIFRDSLEKEEFQVFYQPKVNLVNYTLTGAEALCRWMHEGKIVPPNEFIPVLEQSMDICDLDFYMLKHVCQDLRRWREEGKKLVKVSVNLSRRHMDNPNLLEQILTIIDEYEVPHEYIEVELTETTTDVEFKDLRRIVSGLQNANISTSVDDFGVGYSSLNLIREIPWNVLKIDKSFVPVAIGLDQKKDEMFRHLISLAQSLGMECLVEGVETAEQVKILKMNHCFLAQGYFFDRPLPLNEFEQRLSENMLEFA